MFFNFRKGGKARFAIEASVEPVQVLRPPSDSHHFEGVAFSTSGEVIGVAAAEANSVLLYRRNADGRFEETPYSILGGAGSALIYPHDVAFSRWRDTELLAVAERRGVVTFYEKKTADQTYYPQPVFEISGPKAGLDFSDGVAFVPPDSEYVAACSMYIGTTAFYRRASEIGFEVEPRFVIKHRRVPTSDGLAFSRCGRWLAIANHGGHSVGIFERRDPVVPGGDLKYGPDPVAIINDRRLRHPHSVAFTPETNHLVVTNSGANYFCIYEPPDGRFGLGWSRSPILQRSFAPKHIFKEINDRNKMEGGPKGVAIHENSLAVCGPECGVKIYSFGERCLS